LTKEPSCKDEARVGQQGTLTRIWAKRGTRPRIRRDRRFTWAYLFGAICPARGTGAALVMPVVSIDAMNQHLAEISKCVSVSAIALLILDGAGWHSSPQLILPKNIMLMPLPSYAPELNSVENIWDYLRSNFLSHCVWDTYEAIHPRRLLRCLERPHGQIRGYRLNWNERMGTGQNLGRLVLHQDSEQRSMAPCPRK